jgi:hypothetical protein
VVADKTASSTPSCFASRQEAHWSIVLEAFSTAWVCFCKCLCNWPVQTAAEEHETKGLDTDALILVPMVLDRMPDAKESDAELQV